MIVGFFNPELHFERRKKFAKFIYLVLVGTYTYRWMLKSFFTSISYIANFGYIFPIDDHHFGYIIKIESKITTYMMIWVLFSLSFTGEVSPTIQVEISDEKCQVIFLGFQIQNFNDNSSK